MATLKLRAKIHTPDLLQPEFFLPLRDAGSGVVDIALHRGTGSGTFTRATARTTTDANGQIVLVGSGDPCSAYDPVTFEYLGYLPRGARTNLTLSNEDLRSAAAGNPVSAWINTDTTVTVAGTTAPDGSGNGNLCTQGTAGTAIVRQQHTATADVSYAWSGYLKRGNTDWIFFGISSVADPTRFCRGWFNVNTGAIGTTVAGGGATLGQVKVVQHPDGWFRVQICGVIGGGATTIHGNIIAVDADNSFTRTSAYTYYSWRPQFENNATFASSDIPTTTAAVTHNADVLTFAFSGNGDATKGATYAEFGSTNSSSSPQRRVVGVNDGTANNRLFDAFFNTATSMGFFGSNGGVAQYFLSFGAITTQNKFAGSFEANLAAAAVNGTLATPDTSVSLPSSPTTIEVGMFVGGSHLFGPVRNIGIYGNQLPAATLSLMTAEVYNPLIAKWVATGNQKSYALTLQPGPFLALLISPDGSTKREFQSIPLTLDPIADTIWVEAEYVPSTGTPAMAMCTFRESSDGVIFNDLGDTVIQTGAEPFEGSAPFTVGSANNGEAFLDNEVLDAWVYEDGVLVESYGLASYQTMARRRGRR